eukprot:UN11758
MSTMLSVVPLIGNQLFVLHQDFFSNHLILFEQI